MTLRIPDADRLWLSLGMSYHFNPCWSLDLGYTHVFAETARITDGSPATGVFAGTAGGDADVVSLGFSGNF
jgi:long-chain fatty acid transport protein